MNVLGSSGIAACIAGVVVAATGHALIGGLFFLIGAGLVIGGKLATEKSSANGEGI